jgi:hypothetical protein
LSTYGTNKASDVPSRTKRIETESPIPIKFIINGLGIPTQANSKKGKTLILDKP